MRVQAGRHDDAVDWAARGAELGAGEILLNSMDADGTKTGFDLDMLRRVRDEAALPRVPERNVGKEEKDVEERSKERDETRKKRKKKMKDMKVISDEKLIKKEK